MSGILSKVHLGVPVSKEDGSLVVYAIAHADLSAYQPYEVVASRNTDDNDQDGSNDNDGSAETQAPATLAVPHFVGAPQRDYDEGDVAELLIGGAGKCKVPAAVVANEDFLEVLNAGTTAVVDGTSGSTTHTVGSFARACEANAGTAAAEINVQFLGLPVQVAAS